VRKKILFFFEENVIKFLKIGKEVKKMGKPQTPLSLI